MLSKHIQTVITPDQTPKNNEFIHTIQVLPLKYCKWIKIGLMPIFCVFILVFLLVVLRNLGFG